MMDDTESDSDFPEFTPLRTSSASENFEDHAEEEVGTAPENPLAQGAEEDIVEEVGSNEEEKKAKLQGNTQKKLGKIREMQESLNTVKSQLLWLKADKAEQVEKVSACESVLSRRKLLLSASAQIQALRNHLTDSQSTKSWKARIEGVASACIADMLHLTDLKSRLSQWEQTADLKQMCRKWVWALVLGLVLGLLLRRNLR